MSTRGLELHAVLPATPGFPPQGTLTDHFLTRLATPYRPRGTFQLIFCIAKYDDRVQSRRTEAKEQTAALTETYRRYIAAPRPEVFFVFVPGVFCFFYVFFRCFPFLFLLPLFFLPCFCLVLCFFCFGCPADRAGLANWIGFPFFLSWPYLYGETLVS